MNAGQTDRQLRLQFFRGTAIHFTIIPLAVAGGEAFGETRSMSFSELRKLSAQCSNANLETAMTLSKTVSDQLIAIILYTSGSTGVPKGW